MKHNDPHAQREAEKYDRPIPSRELILEILNNNDEPYNFPAIASELGMHDEEQLTALKRRLRAMERDGQILFNRRKQYIPISRSDLIPGRIIGHPDGFGFLVPDDNSGDLFLSQKQMRRVLHGDRALVSLVAIDKKGRREGSVIEVLEHNTQQVVGRYSAKSGIGFVIPDNSRISQDIFIPPDKAGKAKDGQIVVAAIVEPPTHRAQPIGKIIEVLGEHMAPGMEIDIALRSHDLPHVWPQDVEDQAATFTDEVPEDAKKGRVDLRNIPLVTIDGEDARDFDDAVYCEREDDHWRLLVAIADVSHYVQPESPLDKEAINRGTSVYFPSKVIPMLPTVLSNGLCSLNPKVDRLCMVCDIRISDEGELLSYEFVDAVMHSAARLTYTEMAEMVVDRTIDARNKHKDIIHHLDDLYSLYRILRKQREERGAIDFETVETRIIFGEDRKIEKMLPTERNDAHKLIEECMILANVCAAKFLNKKKIPALHRGHPRPETESIDNLREFLAGIGLSLAGGDTPEPSDYAHLLDSVKGRPDAHLIQTVLLRSLSQATYTPDAPGHFGLAQDFYAHFTSPIRRYPDLLVHRAIRHLIQGNPAETFRYSYQDMVNLGESCSMTERRAEDASRDVVAWLKSEYMQDKVGESFSGIITAVTGFGLFVELDEIYVEGLVHVTSLRSDYYKFDPIRHQLVGEHSGKRYRLGDSIKITVARVDLDERKIDFVLPETGMDKAQSRKKKRKSKKKK